MKIREMFTQWRRIIMLARKPDREELMLSVKISLLVFFVVGGIAYLIRLTASLLTQAS